MPFNFKKMSKFKLKYLGKFGPRSQSHRMSVESASDKRTSLLQQGLNYDSEMFVGKAS